MTSQLALLVGTGAWCKSVYISIVAPNQYQPIHNRVLGLLKISCSAVTQEGEVYLRSEIDRASGTSHSLYCVGAESYRGG